MCNIKYYNVPLIKDLEFAADFIVHYFKFQEYIEIEEQYLGRKPNAEEVKSLLVEWMLDPSLKEIHGSTT
jgi:hypothetical protein